MNVVTYSSLCLSLFLVTSFFIHPSNAAAATTTTTIQPSNLVNKVCNQTSNYTFCVESLYANPKTPHANRQELAYIIFGSAYLNATSTQEHIAKLLNKNANTSQRPLLLRCARDYTKAVSKLAVAYGDLDSETYNSLANYSRTASAAADDCQAAFKGTHSPLTTRNKDLKGLCEICVVVSKLFVTS